MPTRSISSTACRAAPAPAPRSCARTTWAMASPTRSTGLSDDIGSWKMMAMREPRSFCIAGRGRSSSDCPSKATRPPTVALRGSSPRIALAVRLLPDPLSPTRPSASPGAMASDTPRTASVPLRGKATRRPSTDSSATADAPHLVGQPVADQADEEADDDDRQPGKQHHPGRGEHQIAALGDHQPPFGRRRLYAEAEEAQGRAKLDVEHEVAHREDEGRRDGVGQDVPEHDPPVAEAEAARRQHIFPRPQPQHLAADDPGI